MPSYLNRWSFVSFVQLSRHGEEIALWNLREGGLVHMFRRHTSPVVAMVALAAKTSTPFVLSSSEYVCVAFFWPFSRVDQERDAPVEPRDMPSRAGFTRPSKTVFSKQ